MSQAFVQTAQLGLPIKKKRMLIDHFYYTKFTTVRTPLETLSGDQDHRLGPTGRS